MVTRRTKRKRPGSEIPEVACAENPANDPDNRKLSGYPFTDSEVEWVCEKEHLASKLGMYDFDKFFNYEEDIIPDSDLERLVKFADGTLSEWGSNVKSWLEYENVLAICMTSGGWTLTEINLKKQKLILHDAKGYKMQHQPEEREKKKCFFIPMLHLLPQILKSIGYYEKHGIKNPKYKQFSFAFGPFTGRLAYRKMDAADGALCCMKKE